MSSEAGEDGPGGGAADSLTGDERNVVQVAGPTLQVILQDETLAKIFLTLCTMCSLCVGSSVSAQQKRDLTRALRAFAIQGKQGYIMSLVKSPSDRCTFKEADVSVGLTRSNQKIDSDVLVHSDIHMSDLFGLSYLLFKHGNTVHRRLKQVLKEYVYRTFLTMCVQLLFFTTSCFTFRMPFNKVFFAVFMSVFSPTMYFLEAIYYADYG